MEQLRVLTVVISSPGRSLAGEDVMKFVQDTCKARSDMLFGYDWAGSSSADTRDDINQVNWSSIESAVPGRGKAACVSGCTVGP